jgi:hypothetical protein
MFACLFQVYFLLQKNMLILEREKIMCMKENNCERKRENYCLCMFFSAMVLSLWVLVFHEKMMDSWK